MNNNKFINCRTYRYFNKFNINITKMILQPRSPSCGVGKIYSGNFNGILVEGNGILAELCIKNNIEIINSEDL